MNKEAIAFLNDDNVNSSLITEFHTFIKGGKIDKYESIGLGIITPIYFYENNSQWKGVPRTLELAGLYVAEEHIYIAGNYVNSFLFISDYDWNKCDGFSCIVNEIKAKVKEAIRKQIEENYESIQMSKEYDEKRVLDLYNNGIEPSNLMDLRLKSIIETRTYNISLSDNILMLEATNHAVDYESIADEHIQSNNVYSLIAKYKRENYELRKLYESKGYEHAIEVKKVLNKAAEDGKKFVTASFNFGWTSVENVKINTYKDAYTWMQTGKAQDAFTKKYVQPVSMGNYKESNYESYMPFITKISYGKTILFEHNVKIEHELENRFYNVLYRYADSGNTELKAEVLELLKIPELDLTVRVGVASALSIIFNFYTELEVIKAIVDKGNGLFDDEIKSVHEKYTSEEYKYRRNFSRNFSSILEYFGKKLQEQNN